NRMSMPMAAGPAAATASTSLAMVSRGHGQAPSASIDLRSMSTTTTRTSVRRPRHDRTRWSMSSTASKAFSRTGSCQAGGMSAVSTSHDARVTKPATAGPRPRRILAMVLPCGLGQLDRITEQAVQRADDGARALQDAEGGIHFRPAGAQELRQLALRETEVERHALARRPLRLAQGVEEKAGEPHFQRMQRDGLELAGRVAQPPAQAGDDAGRDARPRRPQVAKGLALERIGDHVGQRGGIGSSRAAVERGNLAEQFAGHGVAEAELTPLLGGDRQADAAFDDQADAGGRIAAP